MSDLILHQYDESPFSEKVRLIFGFKNLAWKSVAIPIMMPKPDVIALTGGYRRTPVLQIGADIYCDSALICRVIDALTPEPPLYPPATAGISNMLAQWADSALFWTVVPYTLQPASLMHMFRGAPPEFLPALMADRNAMTTGIRRATPVDAAAQLTTSLTWLESLLSEHKFLLGARPCIADFSVAHCLWFFRRVPPIAAIAAPFPKVLAWFERMTALGHGRSDKISSADAIAIAAGARTHAPTQVEPGLGFEPGDQVTVSASDYGADPVPGSLIGLALNDVVIERRDDRAGTVHVHFPRIGYQIKKAS